MKLTTMDDKLKDLIRICKKTKNYKKLTVVGMIFLSNRVNEIGVKLGMRPRKKENGETIYRYCIMINTTLETNFGLTLFSSAFMKLLKEIEHFFLKTRGDILLTQITELYDLYYQLRAIEIPDLTKTLSRSDLINGLPDLGVMSTFFSSHGSTHNETMVNNVLAFRVAQKEHEVTKQLKEQYDPDLFERKILLSQMKHSLSHHHEGKFSIEGTLRDNMVYQRSVEHTVGYVLLGIFTLTCVLGIAILFEMVFYPALSASLGMILFLILGLGGLLFFIYWKEFMR